MTIMEIVKGMPAACDTPNAERWARAMELIFHDELEGGSAVWNMNAEDEGNPVNRLQQAFAWKHYAENKNLAEHCEAVVLKLMLEHYNKEHGCNYDTSYVEAKLALYPGDEYKDASNQVAGSWL